MNDRKIKFRVWDNELKKFSSYFSQLFIPCWVAPVIGNSNIYIAFEGYRANVVIQQYIGLNDKNNKEIYEGDLIQYKANSSYDNLIFEVKWSNDKLGFIFQAKSGEVLTNEWTPNGERFNNLEIVGNIFEGKINI